MLKGFPAVVLMGRVPVLSRANAPSVTAKHTKPATSVVTIEIGFTQFFIISSCFIRSSGCLINGRNRELRRIMTTNYACRVTRSVDEAMLHG
jgi:hypothetical protein